jgi:hypothetical protein
MQKKTLLIIASVLTSASLLTALLLILGGVHAQAAPTATDIISVAQDSGVELSPGYSQEGKPGTVVTYTHIITNTGTTSDTFTLEATSSQSWPVKLLGGSYPTATLHLPLSLTVEMTDTFVVSLTVPATVTGGTTDYTTVTATSQTSPTVQYSITDTTTVRAYVYLPLVMRNYATLTNGGFDAGLNGWDTGGGPLPFNGHGGGLPQRVTFFEGDKRALLGDPDKPDGSIPVGYGYIAQTFTVDKPHLQLQYRVVSYDIVTGTYPYYDTFEVSVNTRPDQIQNADRNSAALNPDGITLTVSTDGLVFYGGRSGIRSDVGTLWDSGWMTATLDLSAFQRENITLYLSIWSREYNAPYYDDRGWYNTWAYVDNVSLHD